MAEGDARISLSEERLRAALAEMELRLRIYFDEQLKHKADSTPVAVLAARVEALDRGDFSDVHRRALTEFIEQHETRAEGKTWTRNERLFGAVGMFITIVMAAVAIYFGLSAQAQASADPDSAPVAQEVAA